MVRGADESLAEELWRRLGEAVEAQLISDVPVGIFLSGGVDSSCVAALAARRAPGRMKAFSIGFDTKTFDESDYARLVAGRLGVEHIVETLREETLLEVLDPALDQLDEPLGDPSYLPTFLLSRLAARHVKVVVGGDGGDELWAGYPTYRAHRYAAIYGTVPAPLRALLASQAIDRLPVDHRYQSLEWKLRRFTQRFDDDRVRRHLRWMSALDLPDLATALGRNGSRRAGAGDAGHAPARRRRRLAQPDPRARLHDLHAGLGADQGRPRVDGARPGGAAAAARQPGGRLGFPPVVALQAARPAAASICSSAPRRAACPTRSSIARRKASRSRSRAGSPDRCGRASTRSWPAHRCGISACSISRRSQPGIASTSSTSSDRSKPLWALLVLDHWVRRQPAFYRRGGGSQVERTNAAARASAGLGARP